jgi:ornithine carbamoyltransferase
VRLAYVGDGNNVAHSLLRAGALAGVHVAVATPPGYEPDAAVVDEATALAARSGGSVAIGTDPAVAVKDANAVYTDVWASMGQEAEADARIATFRPFQVDTALLAHAAADAIVLHCLPAHRGEEIAADVIDGPRSAVWDQAENRLHAQKALLELLLAPEALT